MLPPSISHAGRANVKSGLRLDFHDPGCERSHVHTEYLYVSPSVSSSASAGRHLLGDDDEPGGWIQVAEGEGISARYGVVTGDTVRVTLANATGVDRRRSRRLMSATGYTLVDLQVLEESGGKEIYSGQPVPMRSITYILSM